MELVGLFNYWIVIVLMMAGLYVVICKGNVVKKMIGLNVFQVSVIMLYVSMGKIEDLEIFDKVFTEVYNA